MAPGAGEAQSQADRLRDPPDERAAKRRELETGINRWLDAFITHENATREKHRLFSGQHAPPPAKKQEYEAIEASYDQVSFDTFVLLEGLCSGGGKKVDQLGTTPTFHSSAGR